MLDAYGVKPGPAGSFARQCLMARRLSEAGVRFVEICQSGLGPSQQSAQGPDPQLGRRPINRPPPCLPIWSSAGLLDDTLVLFGSEFGRHADRAGARRPRPQHHRLSRCGWPAPA